MFDKLTAKAISCIQVYGGLNIVEKANPPTLPQPSSESCLFHWLSIFLCLLATVGTPTTDRFPKMEDPLIYVLTSGPDFT